MQVNLQPTANTERLIAQLGNASSIVRNAKVLGLTQASLIFQTRSKQEAPVDTNNLRRNILFKVESDGEEARVYVNPAVKYGIFQEEGTGIYGPKHAYIVPRSAKYLAWRAKSGAMVFAKRVKGVMAKWFMKKGSEHLLTQNKKIDETIYNELVRGLS